MTETNPDNHAPESVLARLRELRRGLLHLHKTLLDYEQGMYEQVMGRVTSAELLRLVINDHQFAWLHSISELIVSIDEVLYAGEPVMAEEADSLLAGARQLLKPSEEGSDFERKYFAALQREPDAVLAHRQVTKILG